MPAVNTVSRKSLVKRWRELLLRVVWGAHPAVGLRGHMVVLHLLHPGASEPRRRHRGTPGCLRSRQSQGLTAGRAEPEALLPAVQGNLGGLSPELQPQGLHLWGGCSYPLGNPGP